MGLYADVRDYVSRQLQPAEPSTGIAGGGNLNQPRFINQERDREELERYEAVYRQGGPVSSIIDTRAFMFFGTGTEFTTQDDDITRPVPWADEPVTVAEWLDAQLPHRDNLLVNLGRDAYVYGDWLTETVETRGGDFDRIVTINPKTMEPLFDDSGTIRRWEQFIERGPLQGEIGETFEPEEIGHGALKTLGRHPLGISLIGRAMEQIERWQANQEAISEALQKHAFTRWHVQVQASVDDTELRRIRQRFHQVADYRELTTGRDIEINPLDEGGVGESITDVAEHDLRNLANALGVPPEFTGLMTSTEALSKTNLQRLEREGRGEQRDMAAQFIREVLRNLIDEHSPFPRDIDVDMVFGDIVSDQAATAEWLQRFKGSFTHDEVRELLDAGPVPEGANIDGADPAKESGEVEPGIGGVLSGGPDTGNRRLGEAGHADWEQTWHDLIEHALWTDDTERDLFEFDPEEVPDFVIEALRQAIDESLFSDFDTIPGAARMQVREALLDSLDKQHGWSVTSIADNLQDAVSGLSDTDAERIARTETQSLVSTAREQGYRERLDPDEDQFKWQGPADHRTTEACEWLKAQTNPTHGGEPVAMDRLKELVAEANERFVDHDGREWTPHINCRHQPIRHVG